MLNLSLYYQLWPWVNHTLEIPSPLQTWVQTWILHHRITVTRKKAGVGEIPASGLT